MRLFLSYLVLSLILVGCDDPPHEVLRTPAMMNDAERAVLVSENRVRAELGLRVIGDNWSLYKRENGMEVWKTPRLARNPSSDLKTLFRNSSGYIIKEDDCYCSGKEFTDRNGHNWESITVRYVYNTKEVGIYYSGTNDEVKGILRPVITPFSEFARNATLAEVMGAVRKATNVWFSK